MLPKVASHILHHTSRAAAAFQNQTGHTIRNVLQLQSSPGSSNSPGSISWNGPGSSSSSWGSNGAGPGGAKYNAGSKFYNGYTNAGRGVTQANASSQDSSSGQNDDTDEFIQVRPSLRAPVRTHMRRHSLSLGAGRQERGESLGVLQTVQMHVRSKHAFALSSPEVSDYSGSPVDGLINVNDTSFSRPVLVRRNSTSASVSSEVVDMAPPPPSRSASPSPFVAEPASPRSTAPPPAAEILEGHRTPAYDALRSARDSRDATRVRQEVFTFRTTAENPRVEDFNMALEALHVIRRSGEPASDILETYNDMIGRSITPNIRTYILLISALINREFEIQGLITSLETKDSRRQIKVLPQVEQHVSVHTLRGENNFSSAMSLFNAAISLKVDREIPLSIYFNLIKCCVMDGNVEGAIHVFAHLERRRDILPTAAIFKDMMSVYIQARDLQGAEEVFAEFKSASKIGRVRWNPKSSQQSDSLGSAAHIAQLSVWNKMIEAYIRLGKPEGATEILGQMMDHKPTPGRDFDPIGIPAPSSFTYTTIVTSFCQSGDVKTALSWFEQLLKQGVEETPQSLESRTVPSKPGQIAWAVMLQNLAQEGMAEDLNRLFCVLKNVASGEGLEVRISDRLNVFAANLKRLATCATDVDSMKILDFLEEEVVRQDGTTNKVPVLTISGMRLVVEQLANEYIKLGAFQRALDLLEREVNDATAFIRQSESKGELKSDFAHERIQIIRPTVSNVILNLLPRQMEAGQLNIGHAMRLARLCESLGSLPRGVIAKYYLHAYGLAKERGEEFDFTIDDWKILLLSSISLGSQTTPNEMHEVHQLPDFTFSREIRSLLIDMRRVSAQLHTVHPAVLGQVALAIASQYDADQLSELYREIGPDYERTLIGVGAKRPPTGDSTSLEKKSRLKIDPSYSRFIDEHFPYNPDVTPLLAYSRFQAGEANSVYPLPPTIARLIDSLGRLGEQSKVRHLYEVAQIVLSSLQRGQRPSKWWFQVEDSMVRAYAHAGDTESANIHRLRILDQRGTPSADSYGALIHSIKDTTDDTSNAMALFQESQMARVKPNLYLYNTIISKLAKARKADSALEMFRQMKENGFRPSSITYGAVIAACARVGDTQSAEALFSEMTSQSNFRPRIPPYNTMIQMYISTKPDRERALYYYDTLLNANIQPSAHTYKLLIDVYGTIEPIDVMAMEGVFTRLQNDDKVQVQGTHWGALIHAYGCVKKDLDKALEIFDSIASHPSAVHSSSPLPDSVTYESLINVLVSHKRTDLIPQYIARLKASDIHMTAYIVNFMIKGYATSGDIERARSIFESLSDPPEGVAAPNNHIPHEGAKTCQVPPSAPVFREPSTWEVMVRAELGNGHRDRAVALLDRLQARKFPVAVYNRISGILLDDDISPWSSEQSVSSFDSFGMGHGYS